MSYSFGTLAMNVGNACLNQNAAPRLASVSCGQTATGRNGVISASDSSVAKISHAVFRYFSAFRRPSTVNRHSTWTRKSTSSAETAGSASVSARCLVGTGTSRHSPEFRPSGEAKHTIPAKGESFAVAPSKVVNARTLTAPRGAIDASVNIASQGSRATHGRATAYRRFVGEGV